MYRTMESHFHEHKPGTILTGGGHLPLAARYALGPVSMGEQHGCEVQTENASSLITEGLYVEGLSGITCAIPAADLLEALRLPELE